ncbi:copper resistance protein NlpE N-terminal domain-containing protein [Sphingomonas flavalba]|uniref:copper resistance protein NlpE N-terminal domain-containing protein n=1 Tax=Sphingomonas flavalba TaxID=2559804 RepID=UPI0039DF5236
MKANPVLMLAVVAALAVGGCAPATDVATAGNPDPAHSARNALDWAGAYRGVLPCADCQGIETVVILSADGTFRSQAKYLGKGDQLFSEEGRFTWNDAGNTVTLAGAEPSRYFVGENRLTRLAQDGSRITGALAENYVLSRIGEGVTERYWKLVELNGQPVPALQREPYLILKAEGARMNGFGGCNGFSGSYELDEATARIRFGQVASTMMACTEGMDVESAFHQVLRSVDNYSLNGDHLTLNRARMAPLARFEAVYLR